MAPLLMILFESLFVNYINCLFDLNCRRPPTISNYQVIQVHTTLAVDFELGGFGGSGSHGIYHQCMYSDDKVYRRSVMVGV